MVNKLEFTQTIQNLKESFTDESERLRASIHDLEIENQNLKIEVKLLSTKSEQNDENACAARAKADIVYDKIDEMEQHGRLNSIRIYVLTDTKTKTATQTTDNVLK